MRLVTFSDRISGPRVGRLDGDGEATRVVELAAPTMLDWLRGDGHGPAGRDHALGDVVLLAPVPEPPSARDFYAYEEHVRAGAALRGSEIPEEWYAAPAFYFSNPASIHGPGEPVRRPAGTGQLDFELEIAAVIGEDGEIAGFTLLNDWSARDVQRGEMRVGLGPAKAKDFATSIGPWLVTPDELPLSDGRLQLTATVEIDGVVVSESDAGAMYWSWPQLVAHAARDTRLRPGDLLGSGTLARGCLLELGAGAGDAAGVGDAAGEARWLQPGQTVALQAPGLGRLETPIV